MEQYITQLLSDILAAHRVESRKEVFEEESLEDHITDIERWISGVEEQPFSYYCGLEAEAFPPGNQLSDVDMEKICDAFTAMLNSWNVDPYLPPELPLTRRYELLVGILDDEFTPFNCGTFVFDFCTGYAPECDLKEYCRCLDVWEGDD